MEVPCGGRTNGRVECSLMLGDKHQTEEAPRRRMEKDRHYRAYEGLKATNNGNTSSLKRNIDPSKPRPDQIRCLCFGGVPDKASHHSFLKGFIINVGICAILVGYTVLGSFIFLAIEGGTDGGLQQRTLATIASSNQPQRWNSTVWLNKVSR